MVPVSVRTKDQHGSLGNQVTTMMAPLPVWCEDPARRMEIVRKSMGDLKQSKQAMGATLLTQLADFAPPTIAGPGGPPAVAAALLQPRRHQHPRPAVPALPDGPPDGARLPDGPAGQEPGRLHRDHELRRAGQLRPDRRLRRHARPRGSRQGPGGLDRRADRGRRRAARDLPPLRPEGRRRSRGTTATASARNRRPAEIRPRVVADATAGLPPRRAAPARTPPSSGSAPRRPRPARRNGRGP